MAVHAMGVVVVIVRLTTPVPRVVLWTIAMALIAVSEHAAQPVQVSCAIVKAMATGPIRLRNCAQLQSVRPIRSFVDTWEPVDLLHAHVLLATQATTAKSMTHATTSRVKMAAHASTILTTMLRMTSSASALTDTKASIATYSDARDRPVAIMAENARTLAVIAPMLGKATIV